ncbi:siphovirus ReqiPepy6 Gp37-like family protein [Williamsia muralis]|uniref:Gp37-like protein n=1 Tax=Williamsia marianensis TaxID=85044 RepID=UPI003F16CABA
MDLPIFAVRDRDNRMLGEIPYGSLDATWRRDDVGTGGVRIPEVHPLFPQLAAITDQVVLARIEHRLLWTGRVSVTELAIDPNKRQRSIELTLVDDMIWLKALLGRQNALGDLANQAAAEFDERTGPAETVVKAVFADVIQRLGLPMVIAPPPDPDPSPIVTLKSRMTTLFELFAPAMDAASMGWSIHTHQTGDELPPTLADSGVTAGTIVVDCLPARANPWLTWDEAELGKGSMTFTAPTGTAVTIGGSGEGVEKVYSEIRDDELAASLGPYGLPEVYVDDGQDGGKGPEKLAAVSGGVSVNFDVEDGQPWIAGRDYRVGDFGSGLIAGVPWRAQIGEIALSADVTSGVAYAPKLGQPSPPPEVLVAQAVRRLAADVLAERRHR